jgi:hypothetical protein
MEAVIVTRPDREILAFDPGAETNLQGEKQWDMVLAPVRKAETPQAPKSLEGGRIDILPLVLLCAGFIGRGDRI